MYGNRAPKTRNRMRMTKQILIKHIGVKTLAIVLCFVVPVVGLATDNGYKVTYDGGSVNDVKAGNTVKLNFNADHIALFKRNAEIAAIPVSAVTEISYGQDVHRRIGAAIGIGVFTLGIGALMALTKSKKHFIGLTW